MINPGTTRFGALIALVLVFVGVSAGGTNAVVEPDPDALIRVRTSVSADSVAVGQRFRVRHVFDYPDSLRMLDLSGMDPGACRVLSLTWKDDSSGEGRKIKTADLVLMTLDLEQARFPELAVDFETPSRDTLRVFAEEIVVPVRHVATAGAEPKPLKAQWEAPRSYLKWILLGALAVLAAAILFWLRRRRARVLETPGIPRLPADYVALSDLTRIEKLDLLANGEFKRYYTLITEVIRKYIQERFDVDAMDRTTGELLDELEQCGKRIEHLDGLLSDADLVKFAKHKPGVEVATTALNLARRIVVNTTPKAVVVEGSIEAGADTNKKKNKVSGEHR